MEKGIIGVLKYALSRELEGRNFYLQKVSDIRNESVKKLFLELSEMEDEHVEFINKLIGTVSENTTAIAELSADDNFLNSRKNSEFSYTTPQGIQSYDTSEIAIIRMAYLIEDDFMKFYEEASFYTHNKDLKKILLSLAKWEKTHRDALYGLYRQSMQDYWFDMGFEPLL